MERVAYKFKHIRGKLNAKRNITEHFESKQEKAVISLKMLTTLLILLRFLPTPQAASVLFIVLTVNLSG